MLQIRWHGHSCFEITNDTVVITDPHDGRSIGIPTPSVHGDIILVTHDHYDHNSVKTVEKSGSKLVSDTRKRNINDIVIKGFQTFHDDVQGEKRGLNIVFIFIIDDITFCHMGDLGYIPPESFLSQLGNIDILFIPIGGTYTIDASKACSIIEHIKPRVIVPMHYKIEGLSLPIATNDDFLQQTNYSVLKVGNEIDIEKEELPQEPEVWVFTL